MPKCDFNKVAKQVEIALWHECAPLHFLHIFRTPFPGNTSEGLLLLVLQFCYSLAIILYRMTGLKMYRKFVIYKSTYHNLYFFQ